MLEFEAGMPLFVFAVGAMVFVFAGAIGGAVFVFAGFVLALLALLVFVASPPQAIMLPATRVSARAVSVFFIISS